MGAKRKQEWQWPPAWHDSIYRLWKTHWEREGGAKDGTTPGRRDSNTKREWQRETAERSYHIYSHQKQRSRSVCMCAWERECGKGGGGGGLSPGWLSLSSLSWQSYVGWNEPRYLLHRQTGTHSCWVMDHDKDASTHTKKEINKALNIR